MNTLAFIYNGKLRLVTPITIKRGRFGTALLVAKTRDGKTKSFTMSMIEPLSQALEDQINGVAVLGAVSR